MTYTSLVRHGILDDFFRCVFPAHIMIYENANYGHIRNRRTSFCIYYNDRKIGLPMLTIAVITIVTMANATIAAFLFIFYSSKDSLTITSNKGLKNLFRGQMNSKKISIHLSTYADLSGINRTKRPLADQTCSLHRKAAKRAFSMKFSLN